jgi:hypothetical protein
MRRLAIALLLLFPAPALAASDARVTFTGQPGSGTGNSVASLGGGVLAIGSPFEDNSQGVVHVVLDTSGTGIVGLDDPALKQYEIRGGRVFRAGTAVADAGDVNGDGRDDILLTAPRANGYKVPGRAYVVYGNDDTAPVDLTTLTPQQGFLIDRVVPGSPNATPQDAAGAGDVDGDGRADVVLAGANGDAVLVYASGRRLRIITGGRGAPTVANARDVNGDGRPDLVLGVPQFRPPGRRFPVNSVFVVFGARRDGTMHLTKLGTRGFRVGGLAAQRIYRPPVAGTGDLNRDDRDDIVLVADGGGTVGHRPRAAIVYGSRTNATVDASRSSNRVTRLLGDTANGRVSLLGPVAEVGGGTTAYGSVTGPAAGPYDGSAFLLPRQPSKQGLELNRVATRLVFGKPSGSCGAPAGGMAFAPLGSEVAVGVPAQANCGGAIFVVDRP